MGEEIEIGRRHRVGDGPVSGMIALHETLGGQAAFGKGWTHGSQTTGTVLMTLDEAREIALVLLAFMPKPELT